MRRLTKKDLLIFAPLIIPVIVIFFVISGLLGNWQERISDLLFAAQASSGQIVIVAIDEQSIRTIGQWPWPRATIGELIGNLGSVAVIGIDVNFKEPSRISGNDDARFAQALRSSQAPVILSAEFQPDSSVIHPLPTLLQFTKDGFTNIVVSPDGVVRSARFIQNGFSSFAGQIITQYKARLGVLTEPVPDSQTRIAYLGPNNTFGSVSALDVLSGKMPESFLENKIVLIGATARDLQDYHQTPFGSMAGVEIQANLAQMLLERTFFSASSWWTIAAVILLSLSAWWITIKVKRVLLAVGLIFIPGILYTLLALVAFDRLVFLDIFYPNLALLLTAGTALASQYSLASKERKFIHESFSRYLSPLVIHELLHDPSRLRLGGVKETLTILFSDIRNFTTMSESMTPEQLTAFLNRYLSKMTDIVLDSRGVIDKYIGDAIMAFWGAPFPNPQHARDGILSALKMIRALKEFNDENKKTGQPVIDIGVGLNSGDVTLGNMGSERRFDYTVIGDNVNLASRLEGLTKTYGVNIIISEATAKSLSEEDKEKDSIILREVDRVQVKGKNKPVVLFQVIAEYEKKDTLPILELFNSGREKYYAGNWSGATELFAKVLSQKPSDGPTLVLSQRCTEFILTPPSHWEGVYKHTHK